MLCRTAAVIAVMLSTLILRPTVAGERVPPRANFSGPGTVIQGVECLLFAPDSGGAFVLNGAAEAAAGDYLWITGTVEKECVSTCQEGDGCILAKDVAYAYKGCGQFQPGPQSCTVFAGNDGFSFFVDDTGGADFFTPVYVTAKIISTSCFPVVPEGPGLTNITVSACPESIFSGCGTLKEGIGACPLVFVSDELFNGKPKVFTLENLGPFGLGDHVKVKGAVIEGCYDGAPFFCPADCLIENTIAPCGEAFSACGTLVLQQFCGLIFVTDDGGQYKLQGDFGDVKPGEHILVEGTINLDCGGTVECLFACIDVDSVVPCPNGQNFSGCGQIVVSDSCGKAFFSETGGLMKLENFGDFQVGEVVHVSGVLDPEGGCEPDVLCPCLKNNTITGCSVFTGCGEIVQLIECGFALLTEDDQLYLLGSIEPFSVGDLVNAEGTINPDCNKGIPKFCGGIACLENAVLSPCGETFSGCGQLAQFFECGFALLTDSGQTYLLDSIEPFEVGDVVHAKGTIDPDCKQGAPLFCADIPCLKDAVLGKCFDDCGELVVGVECILFAAQSGGTYVLDNLGGFNIGDFVRVQGSLDPNCNTFCLQGNGCIHNNTIAKCEFFEGCGTLQVGPQSCTLFIADETGKGYVLENYGKFQLGDHVFVSGPVTTGLPTCFPVSIPLIENGSITACEQTFTGCGTLIAVPFCGVALKADVGGFYLLNNIGDFEVGDHVFVKGTLIEDCIVIPECPLGACLDVKTIEKCGETWFSGCADVVIPIACPVSIAADDGSGIFVLVGDDVPPFGSHVFVEGPILPDCVEGFPFCQCVQVVSWGPCIVPADINKDGMVDGADLGLLLSAWGSCGPFQIFCDGDIDGDGDVDGADLGLLLAAWSATS